MTIGGARTDSSGEPTREEPGRAGGATGQPLLSPLRELQLVDAAREGDTESLSVLLRAYQRRVYSICYRMTRHEEEARDLTHDVLLRVIGAIDSYDGRAALSTWIIRITMNCCLSHLRKQKLRRHRSLETGSAAFDVEQGGPAMGSVPEPAQLKEPAPESRVEQDEVRTRLVRALDSLGPDMRAILVLRDLQRLEYQQVAEVLDVPVGTVKSRLFRARDALRAAMEIEMDRPEQAPD